MKIKAMVVACLLVAGSEAQAAGSYPAAVATKAADGLTHLALAPVEVVMEPVSHVIWAEQVGAFQPAGLVLGTIKMPFAVAARLVFGVTDLVFCPFTTSGRQPEQHRLVLFAPTR